MEASDHDIPMQALADALVGGKALHPADADMILEAYPYLSVAASLALRHPEVTEPQRQAYETLLALSTSDIDRLATLLLPDGMNFANFYPPQGPTATPTTDDALDTFLSTYGHTNPREQALLERMIFNPVPADYASTLVSDDNENHTAASANTQAEPGSQDARLDAFLASQSAPATSAPTPEAQTAPSDIEITPAAEDPLEESLAHFYIKRGRYNKAYEIISRLSLNNPEKSIYFADQLRYLRILILNQKYINQQPK